MGRKFNKFSSGQGWLVAGAFFFDLVVVLLIAVFKHKKAGLVGVVRL